MFAGVTAFDLLAAVLVVGSIAALCGWAGGAGARLLFSMRLDRVEGVVMQVLNRAKGAAGQQRTQEHRARFSSAEKEAEELARQLAARGPGRRRVIPPAFNGSPIDAAEEASFAEIEADKERKRKAGAA